MPFIIVRNDITKMDVDVIVNSANQLPEIGGGVDFAIHEAGGSDLVDARISLGPINIGQVKYTPGYKLYSNYVFHTVGPLWRNGKNGEDEDLYNCYYNSLKLAVQLNQESIAFPLISSGVFKYPKEKSLLVARKAINDFLIDHDLTVYMVVLDHDSYVVSKKYYKEIPQIATTSVFLNQLKREMRVNRQHQRQREMPFYSREIKSENLNNFLENELDQIDEGFRDTLFRIIDQKHLKDSQVYKRANLDRRLFSKIRNNPKYQPSKSTACALALALELNTIETRDLLSRAGIALTPAFQFDIIILYFIKKKRFNIMDVNDALFEFDLEPLGAQ